VHIFVKIGSIDLRETKIEMSSDTFYTYLRIHFALFLWPFVQPVGTDAKQEAKLSLG